MQPRPTGEPARRCAQTPFRFPAGGRKRDFGHSPHDSTKNGGAVPIPRAGQSLCQTMGGVHDTGNEARTHTALPAMARRCGAYLKKYGVRGNISACVREVRTERRVGALSIQCVNCVLMKYSDKCGSEKLRRRRFGERAARAAKVWATAAAWSWQNSSSKKKMVSMVSITIDKKQQEHDHVEQLGVVGHCG